MQKFLKNFRKRGISFYQRHEWKGDIFTSTLSLRLKHDNYSIFTIVESKYRAASISSLKVLYALTWDTHVYICVA